MQEADPKTVSDALEDLPLPEDSHRDFLARYDPVAVSRLVRLFDRTPGNEFALAVIEAGPRSERAAVLAWLQQQAGIRNWKLCLLDTRDLNGESILDVASRRVEQVPAGIFAAFGFEDQLYNTGGNASPFRTLNLARDLLAERVPRVWCLVIHPRSRLLLYEQGPDLCDFVSVWIEAPGVLNTDTDNLAPSPSLSPSPESLSTLPPLPLEHPELEAVRAHLREWRLDAARDSLVSFRIHHAGDAERLASVCTYLEAEILRREGRWRKAAEKLREALRDRGEWDAWTALSAVVLASLEQDLGDVSQARERLRQIRRWLDNHTLPILEAEWNVVQGDHEYRTGDWDAARAHFESAHRVYQSLGSKIDAAVCMGRIADILRARGELDEALHIRKEEQLPVVERLGDVRSKAVTMGQIADILQARGELDEALHIRKEEQLPVVERLGDVREKAVTLGKIADILQAQGELDEALRICEEEQLPVVERLGDVREKAVTMGRIADILRARGEVDEALRIRKEEQLPVVERLGDINGEAACRWRIGRTQLERGQVQEAFENLDRAFQLSRHLKRPDGIAAVGVDLGRLLHAAGQSEPARQVFSLALDAAEKIGWSDVVDVCREQLGRIEKSPPKAPEHPTER